ncbi:hypothetical protein IAG44_00440 [Streptomyces roseirectus]|uniref:Uncharacterized protein n=2 Tax=Streptomyces roseirectus TaxID=2768066 RepID=A0A7H0IRT4_9ACTN|nr:hypothetical protein IAG44_00440 [Streptomyces roseirectus]
MVGVGFMAFGVYLLADLRELADVLVWLGAAVVLHDGVVVPLVLAVGAVVGRGVVRGALVVAGAVTVVASPVLLRPGRTANPSVLPLDYGRNWVLAMVAVGVVAGVWSGVRWLRRGRRDGAQ